MFPKIWKDRFSDCMEEAGMLYCKLRGSHKKQKCGTLVCVQAAGL